MITPISIAHAQNVIKEIYADDITDDSYIDVVKMLKEDKRYSQAMRLLGAFPNVNTSAHAVFQKIIGLIFHKIIRFEDMASAIDLIDTVYPKSLSGLEVLCNSFAFNALRPVYTDHYDFMETFHGYLFERFFDKKSITALLKELEPFDMKQCNRRNSNQSASQDFSDTIIKNLYKLYPETLAFQINAAHKHDVKIEKCHFDLIKAMMDDEAGGKMRTIFNLWPVSESGEDYNRVRSIVVQLSENGVELVPPLINSYHFDYLDVKQFRRHYQVLAESMDQSAVHGKLLAIVHRELPIGVEESYLKRIDISLNELSKSKKLNGGFESFIDERLKKSKDNKYDFELFSNSVEDNSALWRVVYNHKKNEPAFMSELAAYINDVKPDLAANMILLDNTLKPTLLKIINRDSRGYVLSHELGF